MTRRTKTDDLVSLHSQLVTELTQITQTLKEGTVTEKVKSLVPVSLLLRELSASLLAEESSARGRILAYLRLNIGHVIDGNELMLVSGISEWARRIRELRCEHGWPVYTGVTLKELQQEEDDVKVEGVSIQSLKADQYILLADERDEEAAARWKYANTVRNSDLSVRDRALLFLRFSVGKPVTGEELRYVSGDKTEWARRVRELRTEFGWPVVTKQNGRPELSVGSYLLEMDRQSPVHDRKIPDPVRAKVLRRDKFTCQDCNWHINEWNRADPRILELHHIVHHVKGGENTEENLVTLCNLCHDERHRAS